MLILVRLLLAWVFLRAGFDVLQKPHPRAETAGWLLDTIRSIVPVMPADNVQVVRANALVQLGAAMLLALNIRPRLAALLLASSIVPTTIGGHAFWRHDDPARRAQQQVHFDKNLAILGGLLLVAAGPQQHRRAVWR
jgi:putative oxidoreductase